MKTIDEPMPICEAEMERLEDQLVEDCKSLGMAESIRSRIKYAGDKAGGHCGNA